MLRNSNFGIALFINILMIFLWISLSGVISRFIGTKRVDYRKFPFRSKDFERKGEFYTENFASDKWYSLLPTTYNRLGSTEEDIRKLETPALKERLTVVCRSELWALLNCFYIVCAAIFDAPYLAFILGMIIILAQIPFIIAARYFRCLILNEIVRKRRELEEQSLLAERSPNVFDLNLF